MNAIGPCGESNRLQWSARCAKDLLKFFIVLLMVIRLGVILLIVVILLLLLLFISIVNFSGLMNVKIIIFLVEKVFLIGNGRSLLVLLSDEAPDHGDIVIIVTIVDLCIENMIDPIHWCIPAWLSWVEWIQNARSPCFSVCQLCQLCLLACRCTMIYRGMMGTWVIGCRNLVYLNVLFLFLFVAATIVTAVAVGR